MTEQEVRTAVVHVLGTIAPEMDVSGLDPAEDFRDQLDIDSMDFLNFAIGLEAELGVTVPERDYPKLSSLNGCVAYLGSKTPVRP